MASRRSSRLLQNVHRCLCPDTCSSTSTSVSASPPKSDVASVSTQKPNCEMCSTSAPSLSYHKRRRCQLQFPHLIRRVKRCFKKRRSSKPTISLVDLPEDVLHLIVEHVMKPPRDGIHPVLTASCIRAVLPLAQTCRTMLAAFRSTLHDLELCHNPHLDDVALGTLFRAAGPFLHRIGVRKCSGLSARAFDALPFHCSKIRAVDVSNTPVDDHAIVSIAYAGTLRLVALAINRCINVSTIALRTLPMLAPRLRFLDIGRLPAVDDMTIAHLASSLPNLRTLVISYCHRVTDNGIAVLGMRSSLISLTMRGLPLVTDAGLRALCRGTGHCLQVLDVLECTGLTIGGYFAAVRKYCPYISKLLERSECSRRLGERCLQDCIIATMPGLIYRISATDAVRRKPALYFLLLDESSLRPFRVSVQGRSLNLSDFGTVLISNFGKKPTRDTRNVLLSRFGYDSPMEDESDDEDCD